ncbi:MAG: hypothetical protein ACTHWA_11165 [Arachnia sp.]
MNKKLIAAATGFTFVAALGLGMTQLAQAETPVPTPNSSASAGETTGAERQGRGHQGGKGLDAETLAAKLGLPEATVSDALSAARAQMDTTRPSSDATDAESEAAQESRQAALVTALASELDIEESAVSSAMTDLRTERDSARAATQRSTIDQAVTDGTLTQTEADAVQKALDAGVLSSRGGGHGHR